MPLFETDPLVDLFKLPYSDPALNSIRLHKLQLKGFRNYRRLSLDLTQKRLLIIGPNGMGKSNFLESVELLGTLRSHRCSRDQDLIHWEEPRALITAIANESEKLELELRSHGGRRALLNGKTLPRQLDLIGPLRCVGFSALDLQLVRGEPALRRHWLDRVVQQLEPIYSDLLARYSKLLKQRRHLWRDWSVRSVSERNSLMDAFDAQMALVSTRIHRRRRRALGRLQPLASSWQSILSKNKELLRLSYKPGSTLEGEENEESWRMAIEEQLIVQRSDEERLGSCLVGPHRDEIEFSLNGTLAKRFGSAGQQRTLVLALKLAELELVQEIYGEPPILLLDDVLGELDPIRQLVLLEAVGEKHQCLVSATHLDAFEGDWQKKSQILKEDSLRVIADFG